MKRNYFLAAICLLWAINANALIISVNGEEIEGGTMELTINEAEEDPLTGKMQMKFEGNLLCNGQLTVTVSRSAADMTDEFCCAGLCIPGTGETSETFYITTSGVADWYVHYTPKPNSHETVVYTFSDNTDTVILTVHYNYDAEGIEHTEAEIQARKVLLDGIVYIEYNNHIYPL